MMSSDKNYVYIIILFILKIIFNGFNIIIFVYINNCINKMQI